MNNRKSSFKKATAIMLSIAIAISTSAISIPVVAAEVSASQSVSDSEGYFKYIILEDGTAQITGHTGNPTEITIPKKIGNAIVTSINDFAFQDFSDLKIVNLPDTITYIGYYAFNGTAYYLDKSNWNDGSLYIGDYLIKVNEETTGEYIIKEGTKAIANLAFGDCNKITDIIIPDSVTFRYTSRHTSMNMSEYSVYSFNVFEYCENLNTLKVSDTNTKYSTKDGVLFDKDKTKLIFCPRSKSGKYIIPEGVNRIGSEAFKYCGKLTDIILPDSLKYIEGSAFYSCTNLTNLSIPESVIAIGCNDNNIFDPNFGNSIFGECPSIEKIEVSENNKKYTSENGVLFNKDKTTFIYCPAKTSELTVPETTEYILPHSFEDAFELKKLNLLCEVDFYDIFGDIPFYNCNNLEEINVTKDNSFYSSIDGILYDTSLSEIIFCPLGKTGTVTLPENINVIENAFSYREKITSIILHKDIVEIANDAFEKCTSLKEIKVDDKNDYYCDIDGVLFDKNKKKLVTFPNQKSDTYVIPDSVNTVCTFAFDNCSNLRSLTIPNSVTNIENCAFNYCNNLTKINLPGNLINLGSRAFSNCENLKDIVLPDGLQKLGDYCFSNCTSLTNINIPDSVTYIGDSCFSNCTSLVNINIPDTVTYIGSNALGYTPIISDESKREDGALYIGKHLIDINFDVSGKFIIKNGTKTICRSAFINRKNITSVVIPESVTRIEEYTFIMCENIKEITLPKSIEYIAPFSIGFTSPYSLTEDFVLYGWSNTIVEEYAKNNEITFIAIAADIPVGDINLNGKITVQDVTLLQRYCANDIELDNNQLIKADFNGNGVINISDATAIQRKIAED